ncbi:MAG: hypothetical protein ACYTGW_22890 [Planctomycetota bacterium]|jgi:hypothetical protein
MQYLIPLLLPWALLCTVPGSAPNNPNPTNPKLDPHYYQAIKIGGVKGDITVIYFTVPFNPERLKGLKPGFGWHLGYASIKTDVPLKVGDTKVPAGQHKLNCRLNEDGKTWTFELQNGELVQAKLQVRRARRQGEEAVAKARDAVAAVEAKLAKAGIPANIVLPTSTFKADDEEHMIMYAINRGWETAGIRQTKPRGKTGVRGTLRVSFSNLHYEFGFEEIIEGAQDPEDEQPNPRRRRRRR